MLGNNKTTCLADNGGPILWRDPETRRMILAGIIGTNPSCDPEAPSINFKVGAYVDWIERQAPEE
ncbi:venom serine protease 34-like isoform X2 [Cotesia typhae]|uniref:venom serine protease 34-like isoform X2 n=1 Tax=Cotesia typhae TaxID=2053667 RepID=UPI003D68495B